jgi:hypothetical protein
MIAWEALEDAVRAWVVAATGLAADRVYFADQDLPVSEIAPRVSIRIGDLVQVGQDSWDHDYDPGRGAGQEVEIRAKGMRTLAVDLQAFAPTTVGAGVTARSLLATAQAMLSLPSVRTALNDAGLGLLEQGTVQRIPQPRQAMQEDRATLSVRFCVSQSVSERLGYIETVIPTYGEGPVLLMESARDLAGLLELERWARTDQPSFPRVVDGPQGRPGVQFSRFGADVVSNVVRNMGHLRDLNSDGAALARVFGDSYSFSWWMRPDAPSTQPGGTSVSQRLFSFIGTDGTLPAQSCFVGVTYNPSTLALLLNTQTPAVIGGTSVNGNASTYAMPAIFPEGSWSHVSVVLARNGLNLEPLSFGATATWYVNGVSVFSDVGDGTSGGSAGPRLSVWPLFPAPRYVATVGGLWSNSSRVFQSGFDGSLADLVLYPRALSAAEVATLYATGPFGLRV